MVKTHLCALPPPVRIVAGAAVNLDSSQCVNRLVRAPFDLKLSCVRRSVVCSPRSLRSAKMPELLHIETPLVQTSADDALDSPSAFAPHISDIQSPKCLPLLGENGQNSPMCIAPTRPAQGSTQGSARSQALVLSTSPRNPRRRWNRRAICFDHGRIRFGPVQAACRGNPGEGCLYSMVTQSSLPPTATTTGAC
ncbi:hypothetical protein C8R46DRAFT_1221958 [Mycena filopes]|nr:hypothetical protein C8R46DRAFT_1221958 [Mycena filopes]